MTSAPAATARHSAYCVHGHVSASVHMGMCICMGMCMVAKCMGTCVCYSPHGHVHVHACQVHGCMCLLQPTCVWVHVHACQVHGCLCLLQPTWACACACFSTCMHQAGCLCTHACRQLADEQELVTTPQACKFAGMQASSQTHRQAYSHTGKLTDTGNLTDTQACQQAHKHAGKLTDTQATSQTHRHAGKLASLQPHNQLTWVIFSRLPLGFRGASVRRTGCSCGGDTRDSSWQLRNKGQQLAVETRNSN